MSNKRTKKKSPPQKSITQSFERLLIENENRLIATPPINHFKIERIENGVSIYLAYKNKYEAKIKTIYSIIFPEGAFVNHFVKDNQNNTFSKTIEAYKSAALFSEEYILSENNLKEAEIINLFFNVGSFGVNAIFGAELVLGFLSPMQLLALQTTASQTTASVKENIKIAPQNITSFVMLHDVLVKLWEACVDMRKQLTVEVEVAS